VSLRVLSRRESREWKKYAAEKTRGMVDEGLEGEELLRRGGIAGLADDVLEAMVLRYDVDGVLGGPEGMVLDMTDRELARAYDLIAEETNPNGAGALQNLMGTFGVAPSQQPSSTPPQPDAGASRPKPSTASRTGR